MPTLTPMLRYAITDRLRFADESGQQAEPARQSALLAQAARLAADGIDFLQLREKEPLGRSPRRARPPPARNPPRLPHAPRAQAPHQLPRRHRHRHLRRRCPPYLRPRLAHPRPGPRALRRSLPPRPHRQPLLPHPRRGRPRRILSPRGAPHPHPLRPRLRKSRRQKCSC